MRRRSLSTESPEFLHSNKSTVNQSTGPAKRTCRTGKSEIPREGEVAVGIQYFAPVLSFRGSLAWRMDLSDRMGDLDAGASPVFLVMPKRKPHLSTIHIHTYFWTFVRSSIPLILGPMARTAS